MASLAVCLRALVALTLGSSSGCGEMNVVVASEQRRDGGGGDCTSAPECNPVAFCGKPSCDAPTGQCEQRPIVCDDHAAPVCGCDGVNYWNDCMRRREGVAASNTGECTTYFALCGGIKGTACPAQGAFCAKLLSNAGQCLPASAGVCWVLPAQCPQDDAGAVWQSCGPHRDCLGTCSAIRTEAPFRSASSCP